MLTVYLLLRHTNALSILCSNSLQNKPENDNYAISAFFRKMMKVVLVMENNAKNCASTICQSLHDSDKRAEKIFIPEYKRYQNRMFPFRKLPIPLHARLSFIGMEVVEAKGAI